MKIIVIVIEPEASTRFINVIDYFGARRPVCQ